ncbi:class I SAM-dependent methyltransferase [Bradyrhizobium roseum]|uniref:class I SAM-dependent methyltransferase n=1 Tax=Bradyrhizobium roseum TaxID=3056648 RepID=UPI00261AC68C|nr:class I SAM-dependent methyltransferase [Bradyrhizobium roseus]WKA30544.1 class I SAM-dependent methyltransferase [Bradyrhizobium roseus]
MPFPIEILRCPQTKSTLKWDGAQLISADGASSYPVIDDIAHFLDDQSNPSQTRSFYEKEGWKRAADGLFGDTRAFMDTRKVPLAFSRKCIRRLNTHFRHGGRFLLDAGSGPIAHDEYLEFGTHFDQRVCVDLSADALRVARSKLGTRGVYLQADLTSLPIQTGSVDAVTCNHVIYQIPADQQAAVFKELWRVLKPGGVAVIVYWWRDTPLQWRLERLVRMFAGRIKPDESDKPSAVVSTPSHFPHSLQWFETQDWPFRYQIEPFRVIGNPFMRSYVSDRWTGKLFLEGVYALQQIAPSYCGRYGQMPAIVLRKDDATAREG